MNCASSPFDYAAFPESVQRNLRAGAASIHSRLGVRLMIGCASDAVHVGLWLHEVHRILGRRHFRGFLGSEFRWKRATACRFMRSATLFHHLPAEVLENFQPTALYVLAAKDVSQSARDEAVESQAGDRGRLSG